jgi:hypothetical protein
MGAYHNRLDKLASLILIKKIELEMLHIHLRAAYASKLDCTDLRRSITDFGGQLAAWESEWESLFRERIEPRNSVAG